MDERLIINEAMRAGQEDALRAEIELRQQPPAPTLTTAEAIGAAFDELDRPWRDNWKIDGADGASSSKKSYPVSGSSLPLKPFSGDS